MCECVWVLKVRNDLTNVGKNMPIRYKDYFRLTVLLRNSKHRKSSEN